MEPPSPPAAPRIFIEERGWRRLVPNLERLVQRAVAAARAAAPGAAVSSVVLTSDRIVQILNTRDRGRNKPTNVLTYEPANPGAGGNIILALGVIRREAAAEGRPLAHHLAHLLVHGVLHLDGEDHHHPGEAMHMEMSEARILRRIGVPNPWKGR